MKLFSPSIYVNLISLIPTSVFSYFFLKSQHSYIRETTANNSRAGATRSALEEEKLVPHPCHTHHHTQTPAHQQSPVSPIFGKVSPDFAWISQVLSVANMMCHGPCCLPGVNSSISLWSKRSFEPPP